MIWDEQIAFWSGILVECRFGMPKTPDRMDKDLTQRIKSSAA
jgi:hypothetical protein